MRAVADGNNFRYTGTPNYYKYEPSTMDIIRQANKQQIGGAKGTEPARDNRYPAFAAPMADGRLVTDYRTHCYQNIRVGDQFATKHWMQANAEELMDVSRRRQLEWTGGSLPILDLGPPPADLAVGNADTLDIEPTNYLGGLGLERVGAPAPPLFGSFYYRPQEAEVLNNVSMIRGTVNYEGGRNSPRGRIARVPTSAPIHAPGTNVMASGLPKSGVSEAILKGQTVLS